MKFSDLVKDIINPSQELEVLGLSADSRTVKQGYIFFAISGNKTKGSQFIPQAIENGAIAIIGDEDLSDFSVPYYKVDNIRKVVSLMASRFYTKKPKYIVAVTGTNGKTSTVAFCQQLFCMLGLKSAAIGTLGICSASINIEGETTTPDAIEIHKNLQMLAEHEFEAVAFEASSHGLDQFRVDNIHLNSAGFTNLSRDHLDYHKTLDGYLNAKKRLFADLLPHDGIAVLNADIEEYNKLNSTHNKTISYGHSGSELKLIAINGREIEIEAYGKKYKLKTQLIGHFQIMNVLCAIGLVIGCGFDAEEVINLIPNLLPPCGRLEFAGEYNEAEIYIDYAHTPDALINALQALRPYTKNKLEVIFGAGGDRDKGKRPLMGQAAEEYADTIYVTDDNPRTEDAAIIREEVIAGTKGKGHNIGDRAVAIKTAIENLKSGNILLIAGKGHETYQVVGTQKQHFNDKEEVEKSIARLRKEK